MAVKRESYAGANQANETVRREKMKMRELEAPMFERRIERLANMLIEAQRARDAVAWDFNSATSVYKSKPYLTNLNDLMRSAIQLAESQLKCNDLQTQIAAAQADLHDALEES